MLDQKSIYDKQVSEFIYEYKNRFKAIQVSGNHRCGFAAAINRMDVNSQLQMYDI